MHVGFERFEAAGFWMREREGGLFEGRLGNEKAKCNRSNMRNQKRGDFMLKGMLMLVPLQQVRDCSKIRRIVKGWTT